MIKTTDGVRLIDFEYLHFGDRAMEFAYFLEHGSQAGYINAENIDFVIGYYWSKLCQGTSPIKDPTFSDRLHLHRIFVTTKLLGLLSGGYTSFSQQDINRPLFDDVYLRAKNLIKDL